MQSRQSIALAGILKGGAIMAGKREEQLKEITERLEQGVTELFTSER